MDHPPKHPVVFVHFLFFLNFVFQEITYNLPVISVQYIYIYMCMMSFKMIMKSYSLGSSYCLINVDLPSVFLTWPWKITIFNR